VDLRSPVQNTGTPGQEQGTKTPQKSPGWFLIILGLACIAIGFYAYNKFGNWEEEGGTIHENVVLILLYDIGGKMGTLIGMGVIGLAMLAAGVNSLIKKKRAP
jgi:hypothetical protein